MRWKASWRMEDQKDSQNGWDGGSEGENGISRQGTMEGPSQQESCTLGKSGVFYSKCFWKGNTRMVLSMELI